MSARRPRNEISRSQALSLRAAELLDDGLTDAQVATRLNAAPLATAKSDGAGSAISARTVRSFRAASYQSIADERLQRRDDAQRVQLLLSGAAGTYAQAGQELLAKMLYDFLRAAPEDPAVLVSAGKTLAKIREIEIAQVKADIEKQKFELAHQAEDVAMNTKLSPSEKAAKIREIFGLKAA